MKSDVNNHVCHVVILRVAWCVCMAWSCESLSSISVSGVAHQPPVVVLQACRHGSRASTTTTAARILRRQCGTLPVPTPVRNSSCLFLPSSCMCARHMVCFARSRLCWVHFVAFLAAHARVLNAPASSVSSHH